MKPALPDLLNGVAFAIAMRLAPRLEEHGYLKGEALTTMLLALLSAQEADRAVETLAHENAALKALFAAAATRAFAPELKAALAAAAGAPDPGLRISALSAANAQLRETLIALHHAAEAADWAGDIEARIWAILQDGARARALDLPDV